MCFRAYLLRRRGRYTRVSFVLQESISLEERFLRCLPSRLSSVLALLNFRFFKACYPRVTYCGGINVKGTKVFPFHHKTGYTYGNCARSLFTPLTLATPLRERCESQKGQSSRCYQPTIDTSHRFKRYYKPLRFGIQY